MILSGRDFFRSIHEHDHAVRTSVIDERLKTYAQSGVSFFRDGGDPLGVTVYAKTVAGKYGIDYRTPVYAIHKEGCYGRNLGVSYSDIPQLLSRITHAYQAGADYIKLMVTGIMDFRQEGQLTAGTMSGDELAAAVQAAHGLGLSVMAHCNGAANIAMAIQCGCDSIEHGYYIDHSCLSMMKSSGTIWVPTVAPVANLESSPSCPAAGLRNIVRHHLQMIRSAVESGCTVAPGSDCGSGEVFPGYGTQQEYALLTEYTPLTDADLTEAAQQVSARF